MNYTVTSWLIQQLLEFMSSSDFLNEMHVGDCLALKMESGPVRPSPGAEEDGGTGPIKPTEGGNQMTGGTWADFVFLTTSTFKKHLGAIHRVGAAAHTFQSLAILRLPQTPAFYGRDCKEH